MVLSDCDTALNLNNKYVKALDRRAKTLRKQAMKIENLEIQVNYYIPINFKNSPMKYFFKTKMNNFQC